MTPDNFDSFRNRVIRKMNLVSAAKAAQEAQIHVCATHCYIPGSAVGACGKCGQTVYYADLKTANLPKVCLPCAEKMPEFQTAEFIASRNSAWDQHPLN